MISTSRHRLLLGCFWLLCSLVLTYPAQGKPWHIPGTDQVYHGNLISVQGDLATIRTNEGQDFQLNIASLSQDDQDYCKVAVFVWKKAQPNINCTVISIEEDLVFCADHTSSTLEQKGKPFAISYQSNGNLTVGSTYKFNLYWAGAFIFDIEGKDVPLSIYTFDLDTAVSMLLYQFRNSGNDVDEPPPVAPRDTPRLAGYCGSGFAITETGYIVTNEHVVSGAVQIDVLIDSKSYPAEVVRVNEELDIAVIKVSAVTKPLPLALPGSTRLGEEILVGGYPNPEMLGLNIKITKGIVSSLSGMNDQENRIQIDAAIQGGNSGGPMLNTSGRVAGVIVSTANPKLYANSTGKLPQNINYAVKIDHVIKELLHINGLLALTRTTSVEKHLTHAEALQRSTYHIRVLARKE